MKHIIGIDPGFTATGVAIYNMETRKIEQVGCVKTKPSSKKGKILVANDDLARATVIVRYLSLVIKNYPGILAIELPHGGAQSSRAARTLGIVTGLLAGIEAISKPSLDYFTPGDIKKVICNKVNASKQEVEKGVLDYFKEDVYSKVKNEREHQIDAAACIIAEITFGRLYPMFKQMGGF